MIRLIHGDGYMVINGDEVEIHCNGGDLLYMMIAGLQSMHDECGVMTWDLMRDLKNRCDELFKDEDEEEEDGDA